MPTKKEKCALPSVEKRLKDARAKLREMDNKGKGSWLSAFPKPAFLCVGGCLAGAVGLLLGNWPAPGHTPTEAATGSAIFALGALGSLAIGLHQARRERFERFHHKMTGSFASIFDEAWTRPQSRPATEFAKARIELEEQIERLAGALAIEKAASAGRAAAPAGAATKTQARGARRI